MVVHQCANVLDMRKGEIVLDVSANSHHYHCSNKVKILLLLSADSCGDKGLACFNGGICNEHTGTCSCLAGYGGADCRAGKNIILAIVSIDLSSTMSGISTTLLLQWWMSTSGS